MRATSFGVGTGSRISRRVWLSRLARRARARGHVIDVDSLSVEGIEASDSRLRAALIEAFGKDRYLSAKGATLTHREGRWGSIYRVVADRECTALHEIGSCDFVPVPPFVRTGRQAWAWLAGLELSANDKSRSAPFGIG